MVFSAYKQDQLHIVSIKCAWAVLFFGASHLLLLWSFVSMSSYKWGQEEPMPTRTFSEPCMHKHSVSPKVILVALLLKILMIYVTFNRKIAQLI